MRPEQSSQRSQFLPAKAPSMRPGLTHMLAEHALKCGHNPHFEQPRALAALITGAL